VPVTFEFLDLKITQYSLSFGENALNSKLIPEIPKDLSLETISTYSIEKWIHIYTDQLIITRGMWVLVSAAMTTLMVELRWDHMV
jgi:hypothetical protein